MRSLVWALCLKVGLPLCVAGLSLAMAGCSGCSRDEAVPSDLAEGPDLLPSGETCNAAKLAEGCKIGHCLVSAPSGQTAGLVVNLAELAVSSELAPDAVGTNLCQVTLLSEGVPFPPLTLTVTLDAPAPANAIFFRLPFDGPAERIDTSLVSGSSVSGVIQAVGQYGVTENAGDWLVERIAGQDISSTGDQASFLRNLSSFFFESAAYDGTRLYVANGPRVLIYNTLPPSPSMQPDVVLGQSDLNANGTTHTASQFPNGVQGVWSNGTKLLVSTGNRVLVWNSIPTKSFAPADLVLGQSSFSSNDNNSASVSASTLSLPTQIDSDGNRVLIADFGNHRVLAWNSFPTTIGEAADAVIGQASFSTNGGATGAVPLQQPRGANLDGNGAFVTGAVFGGVSHVASLTSNNPSADFMVHALTSEVQPNNIGMPMAVARVGSGLAIRDAWGDRVAFYRSVPIGMANMDFVLGQPDPLRQVTSLISASSVHPQSSGGLGMTTGGTKFFLPDRNRLLVYDTLPTYNFEPASRVIGQAGFSTNEPVDYRGISALTLAHPADVAISGNVVAVADRGNNRVLIFDLVKLNAGNRTPDFVVGQPDFTSYLPNVDQRSPSASTLSGPTAVALDGTRLFVSDTENHRVLIWNAVPTQNGQPADLVVGQANFSDNRPNRGNGDVSPSDGYSDAGDNGFFRPMGLASTGSRLFVVDQINHRVLIWATLPTQNGQSADGIFGQPGFTANRPNNSQGPYSPSGVGFNLPTGLTLDGTSLWIADTENNRLVRWDNVTTSPVVGAYVGQSDGVTVPNLNYGIAGAVGLAMSQPTTATSVLRPRAIAKSGSRLYVSEMDSNRIHMLDASTFTSLGVLGQTSDTVGLSNSGGLAATSLSTPQGIAATATRLLVTDGANHRLVGYDLATPPTTGTAANLVAGQPGFVTGGFNQASSASASATAQPRGLARLGTDLFVADSSNHRVLIVDAPPTPGAAPKSVYGQENDTLALPNRGGSPSARSLNGPRGVTVAGNFVFIADCGNHRVLGYTRSPFTVEATVVVGQADFNSNGANRGTTPALNTLRSPEGVHFDGTRLYVADTGNHRVLVWNAVPTSLGQAADFVVGQADGSTVLPNRGQLTPDASTLFAPSGIDVVAGAAYVADSGNNRVLRFDDISTGTAVTALGQPDLQSRIPAATLDDLTLLAGPVALTDDGANLYVADRDLGRVVSFPIGDSANAVYGAGLGNLILRGPSGLAAERTAHFTSRLYISDTGQSRIVVLANVSRLIAN